MIVTLIAAHSANRVLSAGGLIPWHLPDDAAHFRRCSEGKWLLVGRRTYDQMHGWFRPGQTPVVVTSDEALTVPAGHSVRSVESGLLLAEQSGTDECMVIGGGEIYAASLHHAGVLILTLVHTTLPGDVFFPVLDPSEWQETWSHHHPADADHAFAFTIGRLVRSQN